MSFYIFQSEASGEIKIEMSAEKVKRMEKRKFQLWRKDMKLMEVFRRVQ
jgi:hypothetical protein